LQWKDSAYPRAYTSHWLKALVAQCDSCHPAEYIQHLNYFTGSKTCGWPYKTQYPRSINI